MTLSKLSPATFFRYIDHLAAVHMSDRSTGSGTECDHYDTPQKVVEVAPEDDHKPKVEADHGNSHSGVVVDLGGTRFPIGAGDRMVVIGLQLQGRLGHTYSIEVHILD